MDFYKILNEVEIGQTINPFAAKKGDDFVEGTVSIDYLNKNFGKFDTANEMIESTNFEGFKLFFAWLKEQGILD